LERAKLDVDGEEAAAAAALLVDPAEAAAADLEAEDLEAEAAEPEEPDAADEVDPEPVKPPVAPVAAILASASAVVVHVMEVPAEFTKGRAAHVVPPAQAVVTNAPFTHCANDPPTQASWPAVQDEEAERVVNWALSF